jgi:hypothetical protein
MTLTCVFNIHFVEILTYGGSCYIHDFWRYDSRFRLPIFDLLSCYSLFIQMLSWTSYAYYNFYSKLLFFYFTKNNDLDCTLNYYSMHKQPFKPKPHHSRLQWSLKWHLGRIHSVDLKMISVPIWQSSQHRLNLRGPLPNTFFNREVILVDYVKRYFEMNYEFRGWKK